MIDPTLDLALRAGLALLFASAALAKLRDLGAFALAVAAYRLLPERLARAAAAGFVCAELALAAALFLPGLHVASALGAAALLALYAGAIAVNLARGRRHIDCGCGGPAARQPISAALAARNLVLAAAACAAALPVAARPLTGLDFVTLAAALAAGALLHAATNALLAHPVAS